MRVAYFLGCQVWNFRELHSYPGCQLRQLGMLRTSRVVKFAYPLGFSRQSSVRSGSTFTYTYLIYAVVQSAVQHTWFGAWTRWERISRSFILPSASRRFKVDHLDTRLWKLSEMITVATLRVSRIDNFKSCSLVELAYPLGLACTVARNAWCIKLHSSIVHRSYKLQINATPSCSMLTQSTQLYELSTKVLRLSYTSWHKIKFTNRSSGRPFDVFIDDFCPFCLNFSSYE